MANTDLDGGRSDVDGVSLTASRSLLALVIVSLGTSRDDGGDGNGDEEEEDDDEDVDASVATAARLLTARTATTAATMAAHAPRSWAEIGPLVVRACVAAVLPAPTTTRTCPVVVNACCADDAPAAAFRLSGPKYPVVGRRILPCHRLTFATVALSYTPFGRMPRIASCRYETSAPVSPSPRSRESADSCRAAATDEVVGGSAARFTLRLRPRLDKAVCVHSLERAESARVLAGVGMAAPRCRRSRFSAEGRRRGTAFSASFPSPRPHRMGGYRAERRHITGPAPGGPIHTYLRARRGDNVCFMAELCK